MYQEEQGWDKPLKTLHLVWFWSDGGWVAVTEGSARLDIQNGSLPWVAVAAACCQELNETLSGRAASDLFSMVVLGQ